ncbi:hypothetical protein DMC14_000250 [Metamycoplasma phocicerebrale]|uniref:Uncharacterized protein n=1 Tax=Metamycoplasma phocicerebrale TaxID=142649 RepID=A0A3Q9VAI9_9BACT|nr:hypothetical protein DMC14_000250 [Metamycoplasma phocicerebrale]
MNWNCFDIFLKIKLSRFFTNSEGNCFSFWSSLISKTTLSISLFKSVYKFLNPLIVFEKISVLIQFIFLLLSTNSNSK